MKLTVKAKELSTKMDRALGVISAKPMTPVLEYVKLEVKSANQAILSGTDLGQSILQRLEVILQSEDMGSILLPARKISEMLKNVPAAADVVVENVGEVLTLAIKSEGSKSKAKVKLPTVPVAGFPQIETIPETQANINIKSLQAITGRVDFAAPSKGGKTSVASILLESTVEDLKAVATDGFRVAVAIAKGAGAGEFSIQLPKTLLPLLKDMGGAVLAFAQSETNFFFRSEDELVLIRKPQTVFPDYKRAYGPKYKTHLRIAVPGLLEAINFATVLVDRTAPAVDIDVKDGVMSLRAGTTLNGESEQEIEVTMSPESVANKIRLNVKFLQEFLTQAEGTLTFSIGGPDKLAKFSDEKGEYEYFIMPLQVAAPAEAKA